MGRTVERRIEPAGGTAALEPATAHEVAQRVHSGRADIAISEQVVAAVELGLDQAPDLMLPLGQFFNSGGLPIIVDDVLIAAAWAW